MDDSDNKPESAAGSVSSLEKGEMVKSYSKDKLIRDPSKNPFLQRNLKHPTSDNHTLIHLVKSSLGTGVLAMPYAFKNAGLVVGIFGTFIVGFICTHCVHIMVKCSHELSWRHNIPFLDFGSIPEVAFKFGPKPTRKLATASKIIIKGFMVVTALGACSVYIVFVSDNVRQTLNDFVGAENNLELQMYILAVSAVLLVIVMIRSLKYLTPLSMLSNLLYLSSIGIIFVNVFTDMPSVSERPLSVSFSRFPVFFSTAVFALEGITVVVPLENNMNRPEHFVGCFRVLNTAMTLIVTIYATVGFFGFLQYGNEVADSISLNLPPGEKSSQAAQLMLACAVAFTYPLQFYCAIDFTWSYINNFLKKKLQPLSGLPGEYIYRVMLLLLTMGIASGVPNLGTLMGIIGAVCVSIVGLMFPAVLETVVYWDDLGPGKVLLVKNILIFLFGVFGFTTGLYTSISDIIADGNTS